MLEVVQLQLLIGPARAGQNPRPCIRLLPHSRYTLLTHSKTREWIFPPQSSRPREGGFENVFSYESRGIGVHLYGGAFLSADRRTVASSQAAVGPAGVQGAILKLTSVTRGQRRIVTTSERPLLDSPPDYEMTYCPGQAAGELLAEHRERVVALDLEENLPAELPERLRKAAERTLSFHVERGVYVWVAPGEEQLSRSILRP